MILIYNLISLIPLHNVYLMVSQTRLIKLYEPIWFHPLNKKERVNFGFCSIHLTSRSNGTGREQVGWIDMANIPILFWLLVRVTHVDIN